MHLAPRNTEQTPCTHIRSVEDIAFVCGVQEWASAALIFLAGRRLGHSSSRSAETRDAMLDGEGVSILAAVILSICDGFLLGSKLGRSERLELMGSWLP